MTGTKIMEMAAAQLELLKLGGNVQVEIQKQKTLEQKNEEMESNLMLLLLIETMETLIMEMDVILLEQLKLVGHALAVLSQQKTHVTIFEEMERNTAQVPHFVMTETQMMEMGAV